MTPVGRKTGRPREPREPRSWTAFPRRARARRRRSAVDLSLSPDGTRRGAPVGSSPAGWDTSHRQTKALIARGTRMRPRRMSGAGPWAGDPRSVRAPHPTPRSSRCWLTERTRRTGYAAASARCPPTRGSEAPATRTGWASRRMRRTPATRSRNRAASTDACGPEIQHPGIVSVAEDRPSLGARHKTRLPNHANSRRGKASRKRRGPIFR